MRTLERRSFLGTAIAALPFALTGAVHKDPNAGEGCPGCRWRGSIWRAPHSPHQLNRFQGCNAGQSM
jgi:hypothetical protein